jgi:hypothetical protein
MVHVPAATRVSAVPATVQIVDVVDAKLTANPDDAVAPKAGGVEPSAALGNAAKVIVWLPCATVKCWLTAVAAAKFASPG